MIYNSWKLEILISGLATILNDTNAGQMFNSEHKQSTVQTFSYLCPV